MLSESEIEFLQESYAKLYDESGAFSRRFYENLFEIAPNARALFSNNIESQGRKFMEVLSIIILDLNDDKLIIPLIEAMGRRHVGYGTKPHHYQTVGDALVKTLNEAFNGQWSPKEKAIWVKLYTHIADIMITAAEDLQIENTALAPAASLAI